MASGDFFSSRGGGVSNFYGTVSIEDSTLSGNMAGGDGGGLFNFYGALNIEDSTLSGNTAGTDGGGVFNQLGSVSIEGSTLSGNTAVEDGGVFSRGSMFRPQGFLSIEDSTLSGNTADSDGGGLFSFYDSLTFNRSLVSGNTAPSGPEVMNVYSAVSADDFNLFGYDNNAGVSGFTPGPNDVIPAAGTDLSDILDPLADNGGPTFTHALVLGSLALDAALSCPPPASDQRGVSRPQDGDGDSAAHCDIGAFELASAGLINASLDLTGVSTTMGPDPGGCPGDVFTISATFENTNATKTFGDLFFEVETLTGGNTLLNSDPAGGGEGATVPVDGSALGVDEVLEPGESFSQDFEVCLAQPRRFRFFVDAFGTEMP